MSEKKIEWSKLSQDEKAKVFWTAFDVKPEISDWYLGLDGGKSWWLCGFNSEHLAQKRLDEVKADPNYAQRYKDSKVYPLYVFKPMTLDALFELAKERKLTLMAIQWDDGSISTGISAGGSYVEKTDWLNCALIDALCVQLLEHAGHEII